MKKLRIRLNELPEAMQLMDEVRALKSPLFPPCHTASRISSGRKVGEKVVNSAKCFRPGRARGEAS